jgi:hypothetical protein
LQRQLKRLQWAVPFFSRSDRKDMSGTRRVLPMDARVPLAGAAGHPPEPIASRADEPNSSRFVLTLPDLSFAVDVFDVQTFPRCEEPKPIVPANRICVPVRRF